jgi:hypothetical protein
MLSTLSPRREVGRGGLVGKDTAVGRGGLAGTGTAVAIAVAATVLGAAPASAAGPGCAGTGCVAAHSTGTIPGRATGPARTGGGHRGGGHAPPPCPPTMACGSITFGAPAPVARVPTIDVAYDARNRLQLPAPRIHTLPGRKTYVRLRTGLWVDRADFAPRSAPAQVPGQTVTAIAKPRSVTWNMGENTITCTSPGDPAGRTCGYTYARSSATQPGRAYPISATVTWDVSWTCTGACDAPAGTYPDPTMSMTTNATLPVGEIQTESRPG